MLCERGWSPCLRKKKAKSIAITNSTIAIPNKKHMLAPTLDGVGPSKER